MLESGPAWQRVSELYRLCAAMRRGYLRYHPDAPESTDERVRRQALEFVRDHQGVDVAGVVY